MFLFLCTVKHFFIYALQYAGLRLMWPVAQYFVFCSFKIMEGAAMYWYDFSKALW